MSVFAKSPMQMRREAEALEKPKRKPKPLPKPGPVDPARRPVLDGANWAAFLRTGSIESRCLARPRAGLRPLGLFAPSLRSLVKIRRLYCGEPLAPHDEPGEPGIWVMPR